MSEPVSGRAVRRGLAALAGLAILLLLAALPGTAQAQAQGPELLPGLRARGSITIGVKSDYPLFGQVAADGTLEGLEIDLARIVAERLGLRAELFGVSSTNRLQRLEDGSVDLVIATLLEPNYYASGVNLMVPPDSTVRDWAELRGRPVCATQGAYFNRLIAERYLLDLQIFGSNRDARLAVRAGRCVGWAYDETAIASDLQNPEWAGWRMALSSTLLTPWAVALPRAARGSDLQGAVEDIIGALHRDGTLIALERRWRIPPSDFLQRTHDLWMAQDAQGDLVCRRAPGNPWPELCRNRALLNSADVTGLMRLGLMVKERTGLDFSVVYDRYDRTSFLLGLLRSLLLAVGSMAGALAFGILAAIAADRRVPVLGPLLRGVLTVLRMTPPLLQIYVVFFGLGLWLAARWSVSLSPMAAVLACLSMYAGAAVAQALLDAGQVLSLGQAGFRLGPATLGRSLQVARGAIAGILVNIVKATGMASVVAVPEIISASTAIMAERGNVTVMMNVLLVTYFLIVLVTVLLLERLLRRLDRPTPAKG